MMRSGKSPGCEILKKVRTTAFLAVLLSWTTLVLAQAERERFLMLSGGVSMLSRQDLIYSPFIHVDNSGHSYNIRYQKKKKLFQFIDIGLSYNTSQIAENLELDMDDHVHMIMPHEFLFLHLHYGIGKSIRRMPAFEEHMGIALKIDLQAGFYNFSLSSMFGYFISESANIWYRRSYQISDRHCFSIQADIPLISWLSRPPYLAEDDEFIKNISSHNSGKIIMAFIGDGKLTTWDKLQRLNLQLGYTYRLSDVLSLGADYRFEFIHHADPRELHSTRQQFNLTAVTKI